MGYCMKQKASQFFISRESLPQVREAIRSMLGDVEDEGRGGAWKGGVKTASWYSWVENEELENAQNAVEAIQAWGWEPELDDDGNIVDIYFQWEKLGQEDLMFQRIAPWVKDGSYIEMSGEDGCVWRWVFKDGECQEIRPTWDYEEN